MNCVRGDRVEGHLVGGCQGRLSRFEVKCPSLAHVLKTWLPAGGALLRGVGNCRKWGTRLKDRYHQGCALGAVSCLAPSSFALCPRVAVS